MIWKGGVPFAVLPTSRAGRWAAVSALASIVLVLSWSFLGRAGGIPGFAFGLVAGFLALDAIVRRGDRALAVFLSLLPLLFVVGFVIGSLAAG